MDFAFNIFALTLIIFGSSSLLLALYLLNKESSTLRWVGYLILSNSIWATSYGFELASTTLEQMKFLINIEYIGITSLPVCWVSFCLDHTGNSKSLQKRSNKILIAIIPFISLILVWTNEFHHLHYTSLAVNHSGSFPTLKIVHGPSYYIFTLYFYVLLIAGIYQLLHKFKNSDAVYRKQNRIMLIGAAIPWIANFAYLMGIRPMENIDITPFAFLVATVMILFAIYRFEIFDTLPIAREKVLELMQDGFIVLDHKSSIIDYNPAFKKYICANQFKSIIGQNISTILNDQHELVLFLEKGDSGKLELLVETLEGTIDLEADVRFLNETKFNRNVVIIKFQDLTILRQEAMKSQQQADELQKLNQLKDRIFSIMAHDLRGPLLNLAEVLKMISDDTISNEEFKFLSPKLTKDISYTTDLLENILHWSRSQLKGYSINREYFDLKTLISSEINYHLKSATDKQIEIKDDLDDDLTAYADLLMMQMVIRNLLSNAIKFCHSGCEIKIAASKTTNDYISICIQDNGVGISEESLQRIFKGENVSSRGTLNEKGTGIGLMVCWDFMERNSGNISIESAVGKGTVFNLQVPLSAIAEVI